MMLLLDRKALITKQSVPLLFILGYLVTFSISLPTYIAWQSVNLILGVIILPFVTSVNTREKSAKRLLWIFILLLIAGCLVPLKTILFFAMLFAVFLLIEHYYGKMNLEPLLVCFFMSPFFQYVVGVFSFSIRISLTEWAGKILTTLGEAVNTSGNVIEANGTEFSVDPACMGLNMVVTSIMLALVLLGIFQKRLKLQLSWFYVIVVLVIVMLLNIISNLVRIILLVKFVILPDNWMHDVVGLLCLIAYVFIPTMFLTKTLIKKYGRQSINENAASLTRPSPWLQLAVFISVVMLSIRVMAKDRATTDLTLNRQAVSEYCTDVVMGNITKLQNQDVLIYIKPIQQFYEADHNPMICWSGSGYKLEKVRPDTIRGIAVYKALLKKENDVLYTAWWYDNGEQQTTSQLVWRWKMMQQARPYSIINVTCSTEQELDRQIQIFYQKSVIKQSFLAKQN